MKDPAAPRSQLDGFRLKDLEARLRADLHQQKLHLGWRNGSPERLEGLEARIQATAKRLNPGSPESAIAAARRANARNDLAIGLLQRAQLPENPLLATDPDRTRTRFLERRLLDEARALEPAEPHRAIAEALPIARQHLASERDLFSGPSSFHDHVEQQLPSTTQRLERLATAPEPSRLERVRENLMALGRLGRLESSVRGLARSRAKLPHRGSVHQLRSALDAVTTPRRQLEQAFEAVFADPAAARERLDAMLRRDGEGATVEQFARNPEALGRLRGRQLGFLGQTPARTRALETARDHAQAAQQLRSTRRSLEQRLESARSLRKLQTFYRQLADAYPSRESLLADLGRHMAGLELNEVKPMLQLGQVQLVQALRRAEVQFLEPLRNATGELSRLQARGVGPSDPSLQAKMQTVAGLFRDAPRHILKRLTPPQMQAALVAVGLAHRIVKTLGRSATV